jgi:hypothetical protein
LTATEFKTWFGGKLDSILLEPNDNPTAPNLPIGSNDNPTAPNHPIGSNDEPLASNQSNDPPDLESNIPTIPTAPTEESEQSQATEEP